MLVVIFMFVSLYVLMGFRKCSYSACMVVMHSYVLTVFLLSMFANVLVQWRSHTNGVRGVRTTCQENT